jgi:hypothetical protein
MDQGVIVDPGGDIGLYQPGAFQRNLAHCPQLVLIPLLISGFSNDFKVREVETSLQTVHYQKLILG